MENSGAVGFEKVKVFAADPWYKAQPGSIKNIEINVKGNMNIIWDKKQSFWHRPNHLSLLLPNLGKLIFCQKQKNGFEAAGIIFCASLTKNTLVNSLSGVGPLSQDEIHDILQEGENSLSNSPQAMILVGERR